eukprot:g4357.t1
MSDIDEFDGFEDASDDGMNEEEKKWKPVSKEELVSTLTRFYKKTSQTQMTPELIAKAAEAYFRPFALPFNSFKTVEFEGSADARVQNGICLARHRDFKLRGKSYLEDGIKFPSKKSAFGFAGTGAFITSKPMTHVAQNLPPLKQWIEEHVDACESVFIQTWMIPGPPYLQVVNVFYRTLKRGEDEAFDLNFDTFCDGDDAVRNSKLKFKVLFASSPMLVTGAIKVLGGDRPCLIGNKLTTHYFKGTNYLEADIDIDSSIIARKVAGVAIRQGGASLVVDQGFVIEGHSEAELPERLISGYRYSHIDVDHVCVDFTDLKKPKPYVPEDRGSIASAMSLGK